MHSEGLRLNTMRQLTISSDVTRLFVLSLVLISTLDGRTQPQRPTVSEAQTGGQFDGTWWLRTSSDEHSGFLDGADDCLTWTAHKQLWTKNQKGYGGTWSQMNDAITKFYKDHPESQNLGVVEVWRKVINESNKKPTASSENAEIWKNPHWYMDGFWWLDETQEQKQGFIEGYLWCMRTQVPGPLETYSKSAHFYVEKIDAFTKANAGSKANREKVAVILRRYRDKKETTANQNEPGSNQRVD